MQERRHDKKILLISEALSAPFDEGIKNIAFSFHSQLQMKGDVLSVTKEGNNTDDLKISKTALNKMFFNYKLKKLIMSYSPDIILYIPEASITFNSFLRARVLRHMNRLSKIVMLGIQHREHSSFQDRLITSFFKPDLLLIFNKADEAFYLEKGINVKVLPPAIDCVRFSPTENTEKEKIRAEFNIPDNKKVVLHVGHIKTGRNVECLLKLQQIDNIQVVIVGSTSTKQENRLKEILVNADVKVIDEFTPDISRIYKMSDVYVFPVVSNTNAIDMPLSILEAMASNLPIVTTRFGGLPYYFKEDSGFRYFNSAEELVELVKNMIGIETCNNEKMEHFTWDKFTEEIIAACTELT